MLLDIKNWYIILLTFIIVIINTSVSNVSSFNIYHTCLLTGNSLLLCCKLRWIPLPQCQITKTTICRLLVIAPSYPVVWWPAKTEQSERLHQQGVCPTDGRWSDPLHPWRERSLGYMNTSSAQTWATGHSGAAEQKIEEEKLRALFFLCFLAAFSLSFFFSYSPCDVCHTIQKGAEITQAR